MSIPLLVDSEKPPSILPCTGQPQSTLSSSPAAVSGCVSALADCVPGFAPPAGPPAALAAWSEYASLPVFGQFFAPFGPVVLAVGAVVAPGAPMGRASTCACGVTTPT